MTSLFPDVAEDRKFARTPRDGDPVADTATLHESNGGEGDRCEDLDGPSEIPAREKRDPGEPDMTPMVDVTFLLLIFFMVTASFSLQKAIPMPRQDSQLPSPSPSPPNPLELDVIELHINENGSFLVLAQQWQRESPGKQNLISALKDAVGNDSANFKLEIRVHESAKLQILVDAIDAATIIGIAELQVTEVDGETRNQT